MFLIGWRELLVTNDRRYFEAVLDALNQHKIAYKEKLQNMGHSTRRGGQISAVGENPGSAVIYQVYVRKSQLEEGKHIQNQCVRN